MSREGQLALRPRLFASLVEAVVGHAQLLGNLNHADTGLVTQPDGFALEFRRVNPALFHLAFRCAAEAYLRLRFSGAISVLDST